MNAGIWTGMYAELPLHEALRTLHGCGWRAFEISTEHLAAIESAPEPQREIDLALQCVSELALAAPQAHAHLKADVASPDVAQREQDLARLLAHTELAARLGVRHVVMHPGGKGRCTTRAELQRTRQLNVEAFCRLGDFAGERQLTIGIENLMGRGVATPLELLDLLDAIQHPAIGITLDTSHANAVGLAVPSVIRELGPRLVATHISDNNGTSDQHLSPGGGTIDWPASMRAFRETGYTGIFNLEIPGERHQTPALRQLKARHALAVTTWLLSLAE